MEAGNMNAANVTEKKEFREDIVNKVTYLKTEALAQDTYYFKPGQVLDWHRHPGGDQIFFVHDGTGTFYLDEAGEKTTPLAPGCVVLAPKNVWHKIVAATELTVSQATSQPAGMEKRG